MSRLLLKLSFLTILILSVTNLIARAIGHTQPDNSAMRGFTEGCEGQPQPCWYGLVPDKTSFDAAVHIVRDHGLPITKSPNETDFPAAMIKADFIDCEVELFRSDRDINLFGGFYFQNCHTLKLGDFFNQLGTPYTVGTNVICDLKPAEPIKPMSYYWTQYADTGIIGLNANPDYWVWLSLNDAVVSFDFAPRGEVLNSPRSWEGFIPFWRYNQLHPDQIMRSSCGP